MKRYRLWRNSGTGRWLLMDRDATPGLDLLLGTRGFLIFNNFEDARQFLVTSNINK